MAQPNANTLAHLEWLGFVQPTGLVVSAPALDKAGAVLQRSDREGQRRLQAAVEYRRSGSGDEPSAFLPDFEAFARAVLGWNFSPRGYAGGSGAPMPEDLSLHLPDYGETLRPHFAVRERDPDDGGPAWQLLVQTLDAGQGFDRVAAGAGRLEASPHSRLERLLRTTRVPAGLLFNGRALRLVSAPHGESSGWMDFNVADMLLVAGRPICTALRLLLNERRLLALPREQRLAALLADSRKYQNEVSEKLAVQVLHALYELLRGFQAAHDASRGELLNEQLREDRNDVYRGLLTVVLRLVFLLYAEERGLLSDNRTFERHYSLAGLYERLRADAALHPDTMNQRYGAWAGLLTLFRMVHNGAEAARLRLPPRHGVLFDPDRYKFLEGRPLVGAAQNHERVQAPRVSDGTIFRALEKLLVLDSERLSYRALDVEQIGSVYETMMGFQLERAEGRSAAIKAAKKHGAPAAVNLEELLEQAPGSRARWLRERSDRNLTAKAAKAVRDAATLDELHAALDNVIDRDATPDLVRRDDLILQPSEERRRSGSHYTPRSLTGPIVSETLEPILDRLREAAGPVPRPEQILDLKICDPAMGSGAFLVEACRQLGDALVESWRYHDATPDIPPDSDETVHARRLVARNSLYGGRPQSRRRRPGEALPVAGDTRQGPPADVPRPCLPPRRLARRPDPGTDPGLPLEGRPESASQAGIETTWIREQVEKALRLRREIQGAGEETPDWELRDRLDEADSELARVKTHGDLAVAAFFEGKKPKEREELRREFAQALQSPAGDEAAADHAVRRPSGPHSAQVQASATSTAPGADAEATLSGPPGAHVYAGWLYNLRKANPPLAPFHWQTEFPEVFLPEERKNPGFDALVGNPPFLGGKRISTTLGAGYRDWLANTHSGSSSNADLVAHFLRRAFHMLCERGALGLIATNTIAQGDTRSTGLRFVCERGGEIYSARRRVQWPGLAAVVVSVVQVHRGAWAGPRLLDGSPVAKITAFLFHRGGHDDPARLAGNAGKSFVGMFLRGMGFTFDDTDTKGVASPLAEMKRLIEQEPQNAEIILPYIGGEELNRSAAHAHHRYVINFRNWPLRREPTGGSWMTADEKQRSKWRQSGIVPADYPDPVAADWPELLRIVGERVKPERSKVLRRAHRLRWWHYGEKRPALSAAIAAMTANEAATAGHEPAKRYGDRLANTPNRVLAISSVGQHASFAFLPANMVYSHALILFPLPTHAAFCALQSRPHELWARFFGSSLEDRLRYTPLRLLRDLPLPGQLGNPPRPRSRRQALLRPPRRPDAPERRRPDQDLQSLPRPLREQPRHPEAPRTPRRHGSRRPRRLRLDRHPHRLRVPPRPRDRRKNLGRQEEALPLPLARRSP